MTQFNNTYLNVTNDFFPPVWASGASIGNSVLYLSLYSIYLIAFIILFYRINRRIKLMNESKAKSRKQVIKKNHIIIFALVLLLVIIEMVNLIFRITGDALSLHSRKNLDNNSKVLTNEYLATWIVNGFSMLFMYSNYIMLFVIMFVVQMIFWRTAMVMRSITKQAFRIIKIISTAVISIAAILFLFCIILMTITLPLTKMELIDYWSAYIVPNFVLLLMVSILFIKDTIVVLVSGFMVIRTIKKSIEKNNKSKGDKLENPFIVIVGLMIGLVLCILLQLFALGLATGLINREQGHLKFVWHFFCELGILLFAILNLCLFYPLFVQTQMVFEELHLDDTKSSNSSTKKTVHTFNQSSRIDEKKIDESFSNRSV